MVEWGVGQQQEFSPIKMHAVYTAWFSFHLWGLASVLGSSVKAKITPNEAVL